MFDENKNIDGERDLYRHLLIVAIKDAISPCYNKYSRKCKNDAIHWFLSREEKYFSFERVTEIVFGNEVNIEKLRDRILYLIRNKKISGVKNLAKVFDKLDIDIMETEDEKET